MLVLINIVILLSTSTICQCQFVADQLYGRAYQANHYVGSTFGGLWEFLITIWKILMPNRPILDHTKEEKAKYRADWERDGLKELQIALIDFLGNKRTARLNINPVHQSGLHLTHGYLSQLQNTMVQKARYKDDGDGHMLQCIVPFEVNGAVVEYNYRYLSKGITHDGKLTAMLPTMPFEATYNLGTEARFWGFVPSHCYVRLYTFRYTGPKDLVLESTSIQLSGRTKSDKAVKKIGTIIGKWAPYMMALAVDSALRSRATNYYYCW